MDCLYYDYILSDRPIVIKDQFWKDTICHPLMYRLRYLNQVGNINQITMNCDQNRYSHSLGTGYLISKILPEHIESSERDKAIFAGLCHDLGHGPFSHSLEHFILPRLGINEWKHEEYSVTFCKKIFDSINEPTFDFKGIENIFEKGTTDGSTDVFQLVSNKVTGFDADRNDYLVRDSFMIQKPLAVDFNRIHKGLQFKKDFNNKRYCQVLTVDAVKELDNFLNYRYQMFNDFYHIPETLGVELMVADIFYEAEPYSEFSKKIFEEEYFINCDDSILRRFKEFNHLSKSLRTLFDDFEHRRFYQHFGDVVFKEDVFEGQSKEERKKMVERVNNEINELIEPVLGKESICYAVMSVDSHKDVNLNQVLVEYEEDHVDNLTKNEELVSIFKRKKKNYLRFFVKNANGKEFAKSSLEKWKNRNKSIFH